MNKNFFRQYNKLILGSIILFFTALLFNHWTPYAADDYSYMFNLSDGSRMTSIGQIFSSLAVHYTKYGNGRLVSHFFVMLFLIGSKWIFNLVNAFLFVLLILSIYHLTSHKKACSLLLFFAIPTLLWLYMPAYGQIFLWMDGSINYMWSYLFALIFLSVYIALLRGNSLSKQTWKLILFCVFTFLFGNYSENVSFPLSLPDFFFCALQCTDRKVSGNFLFIFFRLHVGLLDI